MPVRCAHSRRLAARSLCEASADSDALKKKHVELFYSEAWGNGTPELLPGLCERGVTYCDILGGGCDRFGCQGLAEMIEDCCSSHPLLHIEVEGVHVDSTGLCAIAEWRATAAHLLPGRRGAAPTGLVSRVVGLDQITFGPDGLIRSILSFRDRFAGEGGEEDGEDDDEGDN